MLRPVIIRTIGVAVFVSVTVVACSGGMHPVESDIPLGRAVAPSTIAPGATIRFVVGDDSRLIVGHLSNLTPDSLIIDRCTNCDRLRYGTREISRLEVLRGSSRGKHFAVGLGIGALAGVIIAGLNYARPCHALDTDVCGARAVGFFYGPPLGVLIGGIIGASLPTGERWEPVAAQRTAQ
jgi:hypothetical protein